jgi:glycyl-tRNA synthetase
LPQVNFSLAYEETDYIGKSYYRQDVIGTFYCLTFDTETLSDNTLTIRERDSAKQSKKRINVNDVKDYFNDLHERY